MRQPSSVHHKRIPMGCDQQGRHPEAIERDNATWNTVLTPFIAALLMVTITAALVLIL